MNTDPIGGYLELELKRGQMYHKDGVYLNSARNCFALLLDIRKPSVVYMPYYICNSMVQIANSRGIKIKFYSINNLMELDKDIRVSNEELLVYVNYFGLKNEYAETLANTVDNLIIDNSQAFFSKPINKIDTIYSPRKFFGIPDGGILFSETEMLLPSEDEEVIDFCIHLLGRIEGGATKYYQSYINAQKGFQNKPIKRISKISWRLLQSIDYENINCIRIKNFNRLNSRLFRYNELAVEISNVNRGPLIYPLLIKNGSLLRKYLLSHNIFTATYWPELNDRGVLKTERRFVEDLVALPIDQRYGENEIDLVVNIIEKWLSIN